MHNAREIVFSFIVCDHIGSVFVKVRMQLTINILETYIYISIAIHCCLHMKESECMKKLMNNGVKFKTSDAVRMVLEINYLLATLSTNR